MRARLCARGRGWEEFVELLANYRLDEEERKAADGKPKGRPLQMPAALRRQTPEKKT